MSDRQKQRNALVVTDTRKAQADPSETCAENSDVRDVSTQTEQERTTARRNASACFVTPSPAHTATTSLGDASYTFILIWHNSSHWFKSEAPFQNAFETKACKSSERSTKAFIDRYTPLTPNPKPKKTDCPSDNSHDWPGRLWCYFPGGRKALGDGQHISRRIDDCVQG